MVAQDSKKRPPALNLNPTRETSSSSNSSTTYLNGKSKKLRFVEAIDVHLPIESVQYGQTSKAGREALSKAHISNSPSESAIPRLPDNAAIKTPTMKSLPITNYLSPTLKEELALKKQESMTELEQSKDVKMKIRVRLAKVALRGVHFTCSLIILCMLSTAFAIFNATKSLPRQNGLPPWASNTNAWPQKVVLAIACVSLAVSVMVLIGYCRGGHRHAEKIGVYYTLLAAAWFIFSMILWAMAAGLLQSSRNNDNNQDLWGWSCVQNHRASIFSEKVDYALVCRLQNWTLVCVIIELMVDIISIILFSVVFYRYYSKHRLFKSMDLRDKARSDLYQAQYRQQSVPCTPADEYVQTSTSINEYPPNVYHSQTAFKDRYCTTVKFENGPTEYVANPFSSELELLRVPAEHQVTDPRLKGPLFTSQPSQTATCEVDAVALAGSRYEAIPIPEAYADANVNASSPNRLAHV